MRASTAEPAKQPSATLTSSARMRNRLALIDGRSPCAMHRSLRFRTVSRQSACYLDAAVVAPPWLRQSSRRVSEELTGRWGALS